MLNTQHQQSASNSWSISQIGKCWWVPSNIWAKSTEMEVCYAMKCGQQVALMLQRSKQLISCDQCSAFKRIHIIKQTSNIKDLCVFKHTLLIPLTCLPNQARDLWPIMTMNALHSINKHCHNLTELNPPSRLINTENTFIEKRGASMGECIGGCGT